MSIECEICDSTIYVPDSVWYAGTLFGPRSITICGSCASCIPIEEREPFFDNIPTIITFGLVTADQNSTRSWYNAADAVNGPVRFTASTETIEKYLPNSGFLLKALYPYYRIDWLATNTVEEYQRNKENNPDAREKAVSLLLRFFDLVNYWFKLMEAKAAGVTGTVDVPVIAKPTREQAEALLDGLVKIVGEGKKE